MIKLTINDIPLEVEAGTTVLEAAKRADSGKIQEKEQDKRQIEAHGQNFGGGFMKDKNQHN